VASLCVIGHLARDVVAGATPRIGGGPFHAARALHALSHRAIIVAKCGEADRDAFGNRLATFGLPVAVKSGGETTAFSFSYDAAGVRTMVVDAVGEPWSVSDIPEALLRGVGWLHVPALLHGDFDEDAFAWLARGRRILYDGQGLVRTRKVGPLELSGALDRSVLRHVDVLKLAEEEAAAVGDVRELGVPEVLVTRGPIGSTIVTQDGEADVPARAVDADPTGAGDAFSAAYMASRASGHTSLSAARRATALVGALLAGRVQ
jgi:sugar/nucleoside kinase (ribokinase family)